MLVRFGDLFELMGSCFAECYEAVGFVGAKGQLCVLDRCIGSDATVLETIDNARSVGQVKVDGKVWSARSLDGGIIEENTVVTVKKIEGVKLLVAKK